MTSSYSVAIAQPKIISGGRLRVILGFIDILNSHGIVPDLLTSRLAIDQGKIASRYGRNRLWRTRLIPRIPRIPYDFAILFFNWMIGHYMGPYNLLFNSSNSLMFMPRNTPVISYVHFPREFIIAGAARDFTYPKRLVAPWSIFGIQRRLLRAIYRRNRLSPNHRVICNSEFTSESLSSVYARLPATDIVYPPVEISRFLCTKEERQSSIVTIGRFSPDKRQLEQIEFAGCMPDLQFHIVGFVNSADYYEMCERHVAEQHLHNVHLHPDAPFDEMISLLQFSRYFLHSQINEPFGITAVQAMAAGCIPIVHNSGGQRETVPLEKLRYRDLEEISEIVADLESVGTRGRNAIVHQLQEHVTSNYTEEVFHDRMEAVLVNYLDEVKPKP